jgi:hypothetical protein
VVALVLALGSWTLASPVGSSPDDDYHLGSIWCSHGLQAGRCEPGSSADTRAVPEAVDVAACYRFVNATSASCQYQELSGAGMVETERGNWLSNDYPPVYYWFHGLFVTDDVSNSVLLMRMLNVLIFVGLLAAVFVLVPTGLGVALVGGALVTAVPLGIFLVTSNNPSGWAILSALTLPVALLGYLTTSGRRRYWLGALAALALLLGAGARADSATYAVVAIGVTLVLAFRRVQARREWNRLILPGVLFLAAVFAFFSVGQSASLNASDAPTAQPLTLARLWHTVVEVPTLWPGALGVWGLGWIDTPLPATVWVASWSIFVAVLVLALTGVNIRTRIAVALVALAAFVIPTYFLVAHGVPVGVGVQPRYLLPLLAMLAVVAMVRLDGAPFRLTTGQRWFVVSALIIANTLALHANIRRYVTGVDEWSVNLNTGVEWWWQAPISPMALWLIGSVAFAVAVGYLSRELTGPRSTERRAAAGSTDVSTAPPTPAAAPLPAEVTGSADRRTRATRRESGGGTPQAFARS